MKRKPYVREILFAFVLLDSFNFLFFRCDWGYLNFPLHPYWLVVIFVASRYGLKAGLISSSLAALHLVFFILKALHTKALLEMMIEDGVFLLPAAFIIIGILLGALRQKYIDIEVRLSEEVKELRARLKSSETHVVNIDKVRSALEGRIVSQTSTIKTLYNIAQEISGEDESGIFNGCLGILEEYLHVKCPGIR